MGEREIINAIEPYIGSVVTLVLVATGFLIFRKFIEGLVAGLFVFIGKTFNIDDYVLFNGRQARIKSVGIRYTNFWMYDTSATLSIQNSELNKNNIEKIPPPNPFIGGCKHCENYKPSNNIDKE